MKASIYIPIDKEALYHEAKEKLGDGVSSTFMRCIERELDELKQKTGRIVVEIIPEYSSVKEKKAFDGRWLIGSAEAGQEFTFKSTELIQGTMTVSIAKTAKGRFAVLKWNRYGEAKSLFHYEDLSTLQAALDNGYPMYPQSLLHALTEIDLGVEHIEILDI